VLGEGRINDVGCAPTSDAVSLNREDEWPRRAKLIEARAVDAEHTCKSLIAGASGATNQRFGGLAVARPCPMFAHQSRLAVEGPGR